MKTSPNATLRTAIALPGPAPAIEPGWQKAYLRAVFFTRLMRLLTILAVLLSPIVMIAPAPAGAMAHHGGMMGTAASMPVGHCADLNKDTRDHPDNSVDCTFACAATLPELNVLVDAQTPARAPAESRILTSLDGLDPEAATPPPRLA